MPFKCVVGGCPHKSWVDKTLKFHTFPKDERTRRKWISAVKLRTKKYKWQVSDRICSAHFKDGRKYGNNNIPTIFPRRDVKTGQIVWPVEIFHLLKKKKRVEEDQSEVTVSSNVPEQHCSTFTNKMSIDEKEVRTEPAEVCCETQPSVSQEVVEQSCKCHLEISLLKKRIKRLEEQKEIERFGVRRFMASDSDMRFFTGVPDYQTFVALYNLVKPRPGFSFKSYYNGYSNVSKDPTYVVSRGRPRKLCDIDELFLTMTRLRLGLLEKDLADRFNIAQQEVSEIFATWIDRMSDCLGQLSFSTDRETLKKIYQNASNLIMRTCI